MRPVATRALRLAFVADTALKVAARLWCLDVVGDAVGSTLFGADLFSAADMIFGEWLRLVARIRPRPLPSQRMTLAHALALAFTEVLS
jgi:hypothetical protein